MIQLFFLISMIALAALLLNMFWYMEDSRREEAEFYQDRRIAHRMARSCSPSVTIGRCSVISHDKRSPNYNKGLSEESCSPAYSSQVRFHEIGSSVEVPSFQSDTEIKSKSA